METGFTPDHIKILKSIYGWFIANRIYFEDPETALKEVNHESYGCVKDVDTEPKVCFFENSLRNYIVKEFGAGKYETATKEWKELEILNTTKKQQRTETGETRVKVVKTKEIRFGGSRVNVIQINLKKFYDILNIPEEDQVNITTQDEGDNHTPEEPEPLVTYSKPIVVAIDNDATIYNVLVNEGLV